MQIRGHRDWMARRRIDTCVTPLPLSHCIAAYRDEPISAPCWASSPLGPVPATGPVSVGDSGGLVGAEPAHDLPYGRGYGPLSHVVLIGDRGSWRPPLLADGNESSGVTRSTSTVMLPSAEKQIDDLRYASGVNGLAREQMTEVDRRDKLLQ